MLRAVAMMFVLTLPMWGQAQELLVPHQHHEWASFPEGSWKQVKQVTETFKEGELVSSMTTTLTIRLKEVGKDYIVLEREAKSEVSGQVFEKPIREFRSGLNGQSSGQRVRITPGGEQKISILGKPYNCEVRQMEVLGEPTKITGKVFYNASTPPYILRREHTFKAEGAEAPQKEMVAEVVALNKPYPVLTEIKTVAFIVQKTTSADETTETVEAQCTEVPGFVVGTWMTAYDAAGKLKSKTTVQLLNYEVATEPANATTSKTGLFRNKRQQRRVFDDSE
ncbi:hypothetical protein C5Y96_21625 [Blastopirellula marina]|uniref:Uncharacterized protein n=1 Tax=Blastopirellula marina TaxID=124 RepID=A0A2S8F1P2_9BACT|nr:MULTISPECIES: hypothetical protein [Pirellulaceae]PQO26053.1 hypothetical protein C5Y96_21625 [Blastopirellula marina]RCS44411.1 hypothetical protein DTL36_21670 [Bremerella cremea]